MTVTAPAEVPDLFAGTTRPLLTYYDDATGERTELSSTELAAWAARTAGLLTDGCGLGPGSRLAMLLPPHWQTAAVLLGAWSAGVAVSFRLAATAGLPTLGPGADDPLDATFVSAARLDDWLEEVPPARHRFVLGLAEGGAPMSQPPPGYRDYLTEVAGYPDRLPGSPPVRGTDPASVDGTTYDEWVRVAQSLAIEADLRQGDRLLIDAAQHEHPVRWLLAPLTVGASVVLCANLDPTVVPERTAAERVTRLL